jgi:site-specific recombinase XerD
VGKAGLASHICHENYDEGWACVTNRLQGKLGTHCMRKTFAKKIYEHLGRDLARTQEALGHQHINDTRKYLSFDRAEIDRAILAI